MTDDAIQEEALQTDADLDLTMYVCPMTYVRTKLKLEELEGGQILAVLLKGEAQENVPRSVIQEGHEVLKQVPEGDAIRFFIRKKS